MSSSLLNAHIMMGEPCGPDAEFSQMADWAGEIILNNKPMPLSRHQWLLLKEIGEYLHCENKANEASRKEALQAYFNLHDSCSCQ
jgi:hypothetical protein